MSDEPASDLASRVGFSHSIRTMLEMPQTAEAWEERHQRRQERVKEIAAFKAPPDAHISKYDNPYLEAVHVAFPSIFSHHNWMMRDFDVEDHLLQYDARSMLTHKWAWAIPTDAAIELIASFSPLIEIGAGTGYWAWLVKQAGGDVLCFDEHPPNVVKPSETGATALNGWHGLQELFHPVRQGGPEEVIKRRNRSLFLCWPPYRTPMAMEALSNFTGKHVLYIGERGGCTATPAFENLLSKGFEEIDGTYLPQWQGLHDSLHVFRRRTHAPESAFNE